MASRGRPRKPDDSLARNAAAMRKLRERRAEEENGMPSQGDYFDKQAATAAAKQADWARKMKAATGDPDEPEGGMSTSQATQPLPAPGRQPLRSAPPPAGQGGLKPPQGAQQPSHAPLQDGSRGTIHFSRDELDEFARRGFLKTEKPTWFEVQNALFDVLDAAWAADLEPTPPATSTTDAVPEK